MNTCPICLRVNADEVDLCAVCGEPLGAAPVAPAAPPPRASAGPSERPAPPPSERPATTRTNRPTTVRRSDSPGAVYHLGGSRLQPIRVGEPIGASPAGLSTRLDAPVSAPTSAPTSAPVSAFAPESAGVGAEGSGSAGARCGRCGEAIVPGSRFCRCGAALSAPAPAPTAPEPQARPVIAWYARPFWALRRDRRFLAAMRAANGGARPRFDQRLALRTRLTRAAAALLAVGLVVSQIGPLGVRVRHFAVTHVPIVSALLYTPVPVQGATSRGPTQPAALFGKKPQPWTTTWSGGFSGSCADLHQDPEAMTVSFAGVYTVNLIAIKPGLDVHNKNAALQYRPKRVEIQFTDGSCENLDLNDLPITQRFTVPSGVAVNSTGALVAIVDAYPPLVPGGRAISVSSIQFLTYRWS